MLEGGHVLVDLFFVLSGFVILESYGDRLRSGFPIKQFMILRLGRIYPLHFAAMIVMLAYVTAVHPVRPEFGAATWSEIFRAALLLDGYRVYSYNQIAPVSWTLSVELGLYLVAALILSAGSTRRVIAAAALCGLAGVLALVLAPEWSMMFVRRGLVSFGLGALCHVVYRRAFLTPGPLIASTLEIALIAGLFVMMAIPGLAFGSLLLVQLGFAALVFVMAHDAGVISRLLRRTPFVFLGLVSYSMYLMHVIAINGMVEVFNMVRKATGIEILAAVETERVAQVGALVGLFPVVVGLSACTFFLIERPARDWSRARAAGMGARSAELAAPTI